MYLHLIICMHFKAFICKCDCVVVCSSALSLAFTFDFIFELNIHYAIHTVHIIRLHVVQIAFATEAQLL